MVAIRQVGESELESARNLHNRFTAQDKSLETIRSWYGAVPELFLFAEDDGERIGVCTGRPTGENEASLAGLGLDPSRRGEGIGTRLVERFDATAAEIGIERLSVASAGGYVDEFYASCGYHPERLLVMTSPGELPENYSNLGYDIADERTEDGTKKLYIDVDELDQSFREDVGDAFGGDEAIYIMAKDLTDG